MNRTNNNSAEDIALVNMDTMPLRWGHIRVFLASFPGQFLGAGLATLIGIVMPMLLLTERSPLSPPIQGIISALALIGIMIGSSIIGALSDKYGYLSLFRLCPVIILISALGVIFFQDVWVLSFAMFFIGFAIGGEYSLGSDYISEIMPHKQRLLMVGIAKATSAVGSILFAGTVFIIIKHDATPYIWNHFYIIVSAIALYMIISRIRFKESPGWLLSHGKNEEAEKCVQYFLGEDVIIGQLKEKKKKDNALEPVQNTNQADKFFRQENFPKLIFSGIPWFCESFGVYGIGIFLPTLIMSLGIGTESGKPFLHIVNSVEMTLYINIFILFGFIVGLILLQRVYHVALQFWGFVLCSAGMAIILISYHFHLHAAITIIGFLIFEIWLNAGPNLMTFVIPPEIYSVEDRGSGVGIATSIGKMGAVIAVFLMPNLLKWGGVELVLLVVIIANLIGAFVTAIWGYKVLPNKKKTMQKR